VEKLSWWDAAAYLNKLSELKGLKPAYELSDVVKDDNGSIKSAGVKISAPTIYDTEGYRLPTEAEEESLIRAGTNSPYSYGSCNESAMDDYAWYYENSFYRTHAVGLKKPNLWGIYDVCGNAYRWTNDWYGEYSSNAVANPTGPNAGFNRVVRGGSFLYFDAKFLRSALRYRGSPGARHDYCGVGLRPVRSIH